MKSFLVLGAMIAGLAFFANTNNAEARHGHRGYRGGHYGHHRGHYGHHGRRHYGNRYYGGYGRNYGGYYGGYSRFRNSYYAPSYGVYYNSPGFSIGYGNYNYGCY